MIDAEKLTKHYYTTTEVAEMFDVSSSLIRYWENEFSFLRPGKNTKGERRFNKKNINQIGLIYHLVKEKGFTLDGAAKEISSRKVYYKERNEVLKKMKRIKEELNLLKEKITTVE
ncbi:MAG: MerR family transcriptional regulator [Saprospirales bacterium]|nr:MAG: MerR family transcriptional regulator [Saprospirales bacterium]